MTWLLHRDHDCAAEGCNDRARLAEIVADLRAVARDRDDVAGMSAYLRALADRYDDPHTPNPTAELARLRARIAELQADLALARRDLAEANAALATARHRGDTA